MYIISHLQEAEKSPRKHRCFETIQILQSACLSIANWSVLRVFFFFFLVPSASVAALNICILTVLCPPTECCSVPFFRSVIIKSTLKLTHKEKSGLPDCHDQIKHSYPHHSGNFSFIMRLVDNIFSHLLTYKINKSKDLSVVGSRCTAGASHTVTP